VWTCSAAQAAGAGIGAVVSLKVDYHTHSHAQGLLVIVYEMKESTGGILVCCEHGGITHDGSRKDCWVPYDYDKYDVNSLTPIRVQAGTKNTLPRRFHTVGIVGVIRQTQHNSPHKHHPRGVSFAPPTASIQ
jgi:hypothetical protein